MKLRTKSILLICAGFSILSLLLGITLNIIITNNFSDLEAKTLTENIDRVLNQLTQENNNLNAVTADWAVWDDTYSFINDTNEEFINSNLNYDSFKQININFMLFYNESKSLIYNKAFDFDQQNEIILPTSLFSYISQNKEFLLSHHDNESKHTGVILYNTNETPLLICIRPILHSNNEGPPQGTIILGRFLDDEKVKSFGNITHLDVVLHRSSKQLPIDFEHITTYIQGKSIFIRPINLTYIVGYVFLNDLFGDPLFILEIGMNRDIYNQGLNVIQNLIISLIISVVILIFIVIIILDRFITSRLTALASSVNDVKNYKDLSKQLNIKGNDEIANLEKNINSMLHSLQKTWAMKDSAEFSLQKKIDELERFKTITIDREIKMIELKKQLEELKTREREKT
jgi:sensor domain CHASE-containing protein